MSNTILEKVEIRCQNIAASRYEKMIDEVIKLYRSRLDISCSTNTEYKLDEALRNAFAEFEEHYVNQLTASEREKFFKQFDALGAILTREVLL